MDKFQAVHVSHCAHDLFEQMLGCFLIQKAGHDTVLQLCWRAMYRCKLVQSLPKAELHDKMHVRFSINYLIKPHDIWVIHSGQNVYFTVYSHQLTFLCELLLLISFQRELVAGISVGAFFDNCVHPVSYLVMHGEVSAQIEYGVHPG